jgi:hypothetical protein
MSAAPSKLATYGAALKAMDWQYVMSDDNSRYREGEKQLRELHKMQRVIDPDGVMWLSTPGARGHGAPQPKTEREPFAKAKGTT